MCIQNPVKSRYSKTCVGWIREIMDACMRERMTALPVGTTISSQKPEGQRLSRLCLHKDWLKGHYPVLCKCSNYIPASTTTLLLSRQRLQILGLTSKSSRHQIKSLAICNHHTSSYIFLKGTLETEPLNTRFLFLFTSVSIKMRRSIPTHPFQPWSLFLYLLPFSHPSVPFRIFPPLIFQYVMTNSLI